MKLLLDQHLSPRLVRRLGDAYPDSAHVSDLGLDRADDNDIWNHAREHGFTIVSKDVDFNDLGVVRGFPPKVIWIRRGNCTTDQIEGILRQHSDAIRSMEESDKIGILMLS